MDNARTHLCAVAVALAVVAGRAAPAAAQPDDPKAKRDAREHLQSGDRKLQRGDKLHERGREDAAHDQYAEALADYQAAFDAYPRPKIYFPIALAEQKLGRYLDAYRHYRQLLEEVPDLSGAVRAQVRRHLQEVKRELGALNFVIVPDGASISVNGNEIGIAPLDEPYWLSPGHHTYEITAKGYTPVQGKVDLPAGGVVEEAVTLEKIPEKVEEPKPVVKKKDDDLGPKPHRLPLWIGLGATGALAVTATVTGILAVSEHGTFTDETKSPEARKSARHTGKTLALTTDLLLLATTGAAAYTAYYFYKIYRPEQQAFEQRREARGRGDVSLWVSPYAGPEGGGLAVGGRF